MSRQLTTQPNTLSLLNI